jgi:hypothetical protein
VQNYLSQYAHRNLIETEKHAQFLDWLLQDYPFLDLLNISNNENIPHDLTPPSLHRLSRPKYHVFDIQLSDMMLTPDQQRVFHIILQNSTSIVVMVNRTSSYMFHLSDSVIDVCCQLIISCLYYKILL